MWRGLGGKVVKAGLAVVAWFHLGGAVEATRAGLLVILGAVVPEGAVAALVSTLMVVTFGLPVGFPVGRVGVVVVVFGVVGAAVVVGFLLITNSAGRK